MAQLADPATTPNDRAALYAVLYAVQLRINRALRKARDELIMHMERGNLRRLGPLSVRATFQACACGHQVERHLEREQPGVFPCRACDCAAYRAAEVRRG